LGLSFNGVSHYIIDMSEKKPSKDIAKAPKKDTARKDGGETPEKEIGGYEAEGLLEPTRYGDWEVKGRCSDF